MYDPICCYFMGQEYDFASPCDAECALQIEDAENHKDCYLGLCTLNPTGDPTRDPTTDPTVKPTSSPTNDPTQKPTLSPTYEMCHCALFHAPVCCEGRTYDNACLAECHLHVDDASLECVEGVCTNACSTDYNPICCSDKYGVKTTYDNPCIAEQQGGITHPAEEQDECEMGKCEDCICTKEYEPWCCYGQEYDNICQAECAGIKDPENDKECEYRSCEGTICTTEIDPYCCSKVSYDNPCLAEKDGFADAPNNNKCKPGKCNNYEQPDGPSGGKECICTIELEPYCCDGKDYDNSCLAECDGYKDAGNNKDCEQC